MQAEEQKPRELEEPIVEELQEGLPRDSVLSDQAIPPYHIIRGDVDRFTGDVELEGSLVVMGDITSGCKVAVSGDLEVHGVVEDSRIEAGGRVYIHGGILGNEKASIRAESDVTVKFVQRSTIDAAGDVIIMDSALFSTVLAGGKLVVEGSGVIAGGVARGWVSVVAKEIGFRDPRSQPTEIEAGIDPRIRMKLLSLEESLEDCFGRIVELEKDVAFLREKPCYNLVDDDADYYSTLINLVEAIKECDGRDDLREPYAHLALKYLNLLYYGKKRAQIAEELEGTRDSIVLLPEAEIVVHNIIHRDVRIVFSEHDSFTEQEFLGCRMYLADDEIIVEEGV